jgi:predicted ester cyclase
MHKYFLSLMLFLLIPALVYSQGTKQGSKDAKYKEVYNEVLTALTSGKTDNLDKYMASDFIEHSPSPAMTKKTGIEAAKEIFASYHKIFPDMKAKVNKIAVSGDYLFAYITFTGTTAEPYMGMPANHKMTMNQVELIRFKGDKMAEHWGFISDADVMNMMPHGKPMQGGMEKHK